MSKIGSFIKQGLQDAQNFVENSIEKATNEFEEIFHDGFQETSSPNSQLLGKPEPKKEAPLATTAQERMGQSEDFPVQVRVGDTFAGIILRYRPELKNDSKGLLQAIDELAQYNNLLDPNLIFTGQQIRIPTTFTGKPEISSTSSSQAEPAQQVTSLPTPQTENLSSIASKAAQASPSFDSAVDKLIDYVAVTEGGGNYAAWNPNDWDAGISFGLIQFNQRKGGLPKLILEMYIADPETFLSLANEHGLSQKDCENLLTESWLKGPTSNLNQTKFRNFFEAVGKEPGFQKVQRNEAKASYFDPIAMAAQDAGIQSEKGFAILFDGSVQCGPTQISRFLEEALRKNPQAGEQELISELAHKIDNYVIKLAKDRGETDMRPYSRRTHMLNDPKLSWEAFE